MHETVYITGMPTTTKILQFIFPHFSVLDKFLFVWSVNDNKLHHLLDAFIYKAFKHRSAQLQV